MRNSDKRRYRRISLSLPAQITINSIDDAEGRLVNISPGDMALICDAKVVVGDAVNVRIEDLDEISGAVARLLPDGFAVSFLLPNRRRALLTQQLMLRANEQYTDGLDDRRVSPRHRGADARTPCRLDDGSSLYARIVNSSVDGVSLEANRRPPIGSTIHVARRRGVVMRHTPRGFVVIFEKTAKQPSVNLRAV